LNAVGGSLGLTDVAGFALLLSNQPPKPLLNELRGVSIRGDGPDFLPKIVRYVNGEFRHA
jgi:hypothetical protein